MMDYKEYLKNRVLPDRVLNIFDIDHTLFRTYCDVHVHKDGKHVLTLEHHDLPNYKLKDGEYYDWSEYRKSEHFLKAEPIDRVINEAKEVVSTQSKNSKTIIMTARSDMDDRDMFLGKFRQHGFPIDEVYVERTGNLHEKMVGGVGSPPADLVKATVLKSYLDKNSFDMVRIWEDSNTNIKTLIKVASYYPGVKHEAFLIDGETGDVKKFYASGLNESGVVIPHDGSLGLSRSQLPQLGPKEAFLKELDKLGIKHHPETINPRKLKASQGEFNKDIIQNIMLNPGPRKSAIIVSKDGYVLDGHHRWIAAWNKKEQMPCIRVDMLILDLIALVKRFTGTQYKSLDDMPNKHRPLMTTIKRTLRESA